MIENCLWFETQKGSGKKIVVKIKKIFCRSSLLNSSKSATENPLVKPRYHDCWGASCIDKIAVCNWSVGMICRKRVCGRGTVVDVLKHVDTVNWTEDWIFLSSWLIMGNNSFACRQWGSALSLHHIKSTHCRQKISGFLPKTWSSASNWSKQPKMSPG